MNFVFIKYFKTGSSFYLTDIHKPNKVWNCKEVVKIQGAKLN